MLQDIGKNYYIARYRMATMKTITLSTVQRSPMSVLVSARCFHEGDTCARPQHQHLRETPSRALPLSSMPGPSGLRKLPYIGTALMFKPFTRYSPESFGELVASLHRKYGHVFKSRLGREFSVHTDNAEDAEVIYRSDGQFPLRCLMTLSKVFRERNGLPNALGTVSGPQWQELRTAINPLLMKPSVCLHYLPAQNRVSDDFVSQLHGSVKTPEAQSELFFKFAAESIGVVCFNQRIGFLDPLEGDAPDRLELLEALKICLHSTFVAMIGLERRYLMSRDDPFYVTYESAMKLIRQRALVYVRNVLQEVPSADNVSPTSDRESNLLESMLTQSSLELEKILAIIDSMLIAGTDSTARNLAILFYNLAMNPEQQEKAATEVCELVGKDGPVSPEALSKMNYVKACVKESMRLNFPLANGTERTLGVDVVLGGYQVPKGTSVIMSSSRSSLDPRYFSEPRRFLPERWMRDAGETPSPDAWERKHHPFACLPFGHGARGCIGRRFAEMEIYVATAKLLQKLRVQVDPEYQGLEPVYTPFITPKKPIPFTFTMRHD
ncbi:hypothetical protein Btru_069234 [Bulinus truncatus]|nr:hypothetical protein Btru_069234 [Bulinus truncatus]